MKKEIMELPEDILELHREFKRRGKKLYVVGGAVRDYKLGKEPKDYDLATDALPDETIKIAKSLGFPVLELGKAFGIVVVGDYEIATFREDIGSGRRPESVKFSNIESDVKRRDLTINALFYDIDNGKIFDLTGGLKDLKNKIINTVGDPEERFNEDPLRKLRALRFAVALDAKLNKNVYKVLKENPHLTGISSERIRDEFIKTIDKAKSVKRYLELIDDLNMWGEIFPNLNISNIRAEEKCPIVLIATLLKDNKSINIKEKLKELSYLREERNKIDFLVSLYNFDLNDLLVLKKAQKTYDVSPEQIIKFGRHVGKNFNKFIKFNQTVFIGDVPKDLKGKDIGNWILDKEKKNFSLISELKKIIESRIL